MADSLTAVRDWLYGRLLPVQARVTPGLRNSQFAYRDALYANVTGTWLDIGCGHRMFPTWLDPSGSSQTAIAARAHTRIGLDMDADALTRNTVMTVKHIADVTKPLPVDNDAVDVASANMVVEHVADPPALLREIKRVLVPGGVCIIHTPNRRGYPTQIANMLPEALKKPLAIALIGRKGEDVYPTHYRMNDGDAVRAAAQAAGLEIVSLQYLETSVQTAMLGPVAWLELLWIRCLRVSRLERMRPVLLVVLRKPIR